MTKLPEIASLWIGERLSWLEQLCLKSFADSGHHVTLYSYSEIENVPAGVHLGDAEDIFPSSPMHRHKRTGSPAIHADIWRLHLLSKTDKVWVDADMYCRQPFNFGSEYVFGWEKPGLVCNAVLGLPRDSDALTQALAFFDDEYAIAPWLKPWQRRELEAAKHEGRPVHITEQDWGFTGPALVTWFLGQTGEIKYSQPQAAFYPVSFKERNHLILRKFDVDPAMSKKTYGVHFWARRVKPRLEEKEGNRPQSGSFLDGLLAKHGIDPVKAPIPAKPKKEEPSRMDFPWKPDSARFFVATCMKDEGPFILEWLAWHKSIGIQDFVVFTNHCTDGTDELLDRLEGLGELRRLPNPALATGRTNYQPAAIASVPELPEFEQANFFISMDVDEFINVRVGSGTLSDLLALTGPFDALSISEINHGSNSREHYERGLVTELFARHQTERPGKRKSRRGVKTIVRISEQVAQYRNHRPDFSASETNPIWLDGSGLPLTSLQEDASENGIDVRGTYDLVALDHFPLRSMNSYFAKIFRGDVVVKDKPIGNRYWRLRNQNQDLTSTFERQRPAFIAYMEKLMSDQKLRELHEECCARHEARIAELLKVDEFRQRRQWIFENAWDAKDV